jgi:hypothetical protein
MNQDFFKFRLSQKQSISSIRELLDLDLSHIGRSPIFNFTTGVNDLNRKNKTSALG